MQNDGYAGTSKALFTQARQELGQDDLLQASEKLWGAAAHMVKAVAERRGWRHDSHRALIEAVDRLAQETGDRNISLYFGVAQALHTNFYENWQTRGFIENSLQAIEELIGKLERL